MSLFRTYFRSPKFLLRGIAAYIAYLSIFPPWLSAWIHKSRGVRIKDYRSVYIAPNVLIDTNFPDQITIGDGVYITRGAKLLCHTAYTPMLQAKFDLPDCVVGTITIGDGAYIGVNAIILPNITIGQCAIIGAGAIVSKDIPDFAIAVGIPARVVGDVREIKVAQSQKHER